MSASFGQPARPRMVPLDQQSFNDWVISAIENIRIQLIPPATVTNMRVTPQPGGNLIDFTRSDGDSYTLYINTTPSIELAQRVTLGTGNRYTHSVGVGGVIYYYAIKAKKGNSDGQVSPWVSGETLDVDTPAVEVEPPPDSIIPFTDQETDSIQIAVPQGVDYYPV